MPFQPGNKEGGRKSLYDEEIRFGVLNKCWKIIRDTLNDKNVGIKTKRSIAMKIVERSVPKEIEHKGSFEHKHGIDPESMKQYEKIKKEFEEKLKDHLTK